MQCFILLLLGMESTRTRIESTSNGRIRLVVEQGPDTLKRRQTMFRSP